MAGFNGIALATLISSWTFTVLALLSLILQYISFRFLAKPARRLEYWDWVTTVTFVSSLALVCQTTWAVVDEGQGDHFTNETQAQFELVAKSLTANEVVWTLNSALLRCTAVGLLLRLFTVAINLRVSLWTLLEIGRAHV